MQTMTTCTKVFILAALVTIVVSQSFPKSFVSCSTKAYPSPADPPAVPSPAYSKNEYAPMPYTVSPGLLRTSRRTTTTLTRRWAMTTVTSLAPTASNSQTDALRLSTTRRMTTPHTLLMSSTKERPNTKNTNLPTNRNTNPHILR